MNSIEDNVIQLAIGLNVDDEINTTMYYYITYDVYNTLFKVLKSQMPEVKEEKGKEKAKQEASSKPEEKEEETSATIQPIFFEELTNQDERGDQ
jgi:flagellar basal body-associated protein FliL